MKKLAFLVSLTLALLLGSCNNNDDELTPSAGEAERAETYQAIKQAVDKNFAINEMVPTADGCKALLANGGEMTVKNGQGKQMPLITIGANGNYLLNGTDTGKKPGDAQPTLAAAGGNWLLDGVDTGIVVGQPTEIDTPSVIVILATGDNYVFYLSDGETFTLRQTKTVGLYALAEGTMGGGNGLLVYYDYNTGTGKFVVNESKRFKNFGETPNDLLVYGSKLYCAITGSATDAAVIRVISAATGVTIKDITLTKETVTLQPRRLAAADGKVYVSLYPGAVAQIDTLSYATSVTSLSGTFSEGICAYGANLYICNSGQGKGNTISVVDRASLAEKSTITVPYNPVNIVSAGNGELYFNTASVWSGPAEGAPANVHVLNTSTGKVTHTLDVPAEFITAGKNYIYGAAMDWEDLENLMLKKISIADKKATDFTTDMKSYMFGYKLAVNPLTDEVFITQQMGQFIYRYKEDGTYVETLKTGQQNGAAVAFVNNAW